MVAVPAAETMPYGYSPAVWRLFNTTPRAGDLPADDPCVQRVEIRTPAGRGVLRLALRWADQRVADARFRVYGCPTTIAVGAWLADWLIGRSRTELACLRAADLRQALEIPEDRAHCALMGEDALRALSVTDDGDSRT